MESIRNDPRFQALLITYRTVPTVNAYNQLVEHIDMFIRGEVLANKLNPEPIDLTKGWEPRVAPPQSAIDAYEQWGSSAKELYEYMTENFTGPRKP